MTDRFAARCCRPALATALAAAAAALPGTALGCTVSSPPPAEIGTYSPAAIKASAVPVLATPSSINCGNSVVSVLSGNSFTATVTSTNGFRMTATALPDQPAFGVFADGAGTRPFTPGEPMNYLNPAIVDVAGLLGNSPPAIPLYIRPSATTLVAPGTYSGTFRVAWSWKFCSVAWVLGSCPLGKLDAGSGTADITFRIVVKARPITAVVTSQTTWDPVSKTSFPKAISGSKRRLTVTVSNPDIVAADANTVNVELATPGGTAVALTGDGSGSAGVIVFADGTPPSGLSFRYGTGADTTDDVSFRGSDGSWSYAPAAGDTASEAAVTRIRLRPRGAMAAGSTFAVSLPYLVK